MIKGKTPEEIRKTFNIKNDFTPAEEEQVSFCNIVDTQNAINADKYEVSSSLLILLAHIYNYVVLQFCVVFIEMLLEVTLIQQ